MIGNIFLYQRSLNMLLGNKIILNNYFKFLFHEESSSVIFRENFASFVSFIWGKIGVFRKIFFKFLSFFNFFLKQILFIQENNESSFSDKPEKITNRQFNELNTPSIPSIHTKH